MDSKRLFFRYLPTYPGIEDWGSRVLDAGFTKVDKNSAYPAPVAMKKVEDFTICGAGLA